MYPRLPHFPPRSPALSWTRALPRAGLLALLGLSLGGCEGWPLYAHVPDERITAAPAGTDPSDAIAYTWTNLDRETDPGNDTPPEPAELGVEEGWVLFGSLSDIGWDPTLVTTHTAICGLDVQETEYPPISQGDYTGDLDWLSLVPTADAQLCVRIEVELPEEVPDLQYDLLAYTLDECDNPVSLLRDETGIGLGLTQYASESTWNTDVTAGTPLSLLLAAFVAASSAEVEVPWRLGVALVPSPDGDGSGICPSLPEAP